ncbi:MAG: nucleoside triphosphate pyrophosphohydrolase [Dehalococcoidia bacterium]|nr:nucleoside triphosphate pyrophosphohydrolase [Dehalococcoidia bacterium]
MELPKDLSRFTALEKVIARLRGPEGCPWDKAQTHQSLRETFLQECYEVLEALDEADVNKLREELGDLLLHIVLQARIAEEAGEFKLGNVIAAINKKLIHRHPHVFGQRKVADVSEIVHNWEVLKQEEKGTEKSVITGVPKDLPALSHSQEIQHRVAQVGFDWEDDRGVIEKLAEEVGELTGAETAEKKKEEFGDLLFTLANIARRQEIDLEVALREANRKFARRFQYMEELCRQRDLDFKKLSFDEQNQLWEEAKRGTKNRKKR